MRFLALYHSVEKDYGLNRFEYDESLLLILIDAILHNNFSEISLNIIKTQKITRTIIKAILEKLGEFSFWSYKAIKVKEHIAGICVTKKIINIRELIESDPDKSSAFYVYSRFFRIPDDLVEKYSEHCKHIDISHSYVTLKMYEILRNNEVVRKQISDLFYNSKRDLKITDKYPDDFIDIFPDKKFKYDAYSLGPLLSQKAFRYFSEKLYKINKDALYFFLKVTKNVTEKLLITSISKYNLNAETICNLVSNNDLFFKNSIEKEKFLDYVRVRNLIDNG